MALAAGLLVPAGPARGEMEASQYESGTRRAAPAEAARETQRRHEEAEREAARERSARAQEERAALLRERALAALPEGERLVRQRCTGCHGREAFADVRHGAAGWWAVVVRMELLNGATLGGGDRARIATHLAAEQPAAALPQLAEWLAAAFAVAGPVAGLAALRRRCAKRGRQGVRR